MGLSRPTPAFALRRRRVLVGGALALVALAAVSARAQTLDDGLLMPARALCVGAAYGYDRWDRYWEGTRHRGNENLGAVTTQSAALVGAYGVTDRVNVLAMLPYVWTAASQGPLHGMRGVQDLTVAAKVRVLTTPFTGRGTMHVHAVAAASVPVGAYTPDFLPMSIGLGSRRATGRLTADVEGRGGWTVGGTAAYTRRGHVRLDRDAYYTDGALYLTDRVAMPDVVDYTLRAGLRRGRLYAPVGVTVQRTLGGGDIRRQDMPFVSNRMDFVRVEGLVAYTVPVRSAPVVRLGASHVVAGRNVGQATALTAGLLHTFTF